MLRKPHCREIATQERELRKLRADVNKAVLEARKKKATEAEIRDIHGSWSMDIDIAREEIDYLLTRGAWALTDKYDLEMPSMTDHPELWEERRYGYGHVLTVRGRNHVLGLIRAEEKQRREVVAFWLKDVLAPQVGWIVAITSVILNAVFK